MDGRAHLGRCQPDSTIRGHSIPLPPTCLYWRHRDTSTHHRRLSHPHCRHWWYQHGRDFTPGLLQARTRRIWGPADWYLHQWWVVTTSTDARFWWKMLIVFQTRFLKPRWDLPARDPGSLLRCSCKIFLISIISRWVCWTELIIFSLQQVLSPPPLPIIGQAERIYTLCDPPTRG